MHRFLDLLRALRIRDDAVRRRWTREELDRFQQKQLQALVRHAKENSPFFRDLYKDINVDDDLAVTHLPPTDKVVMMENFDRLVTDDRLKLKDLQKFIPKVQFGDRYLGEYRVFTTSGSTGRRGIFVFNREEWIKAVSTGLRVGYYCGFEKPRFPHRWRFAMIGAGSPLHVTAAYFHAVKSLFFDQLNLPVTTPHDEIVSTLNQFNPDFISCYPSLASLLAVEQLEGNLSIEPTAITTNSEMRTPEMQRNIKDAWGIVPFNNYGTTEAGLNIAVDCHYHQGLHIFEDLFIVETVDGDNNPVPDGQAGAKVLFTNLYNYTQPIIRYEISDVITLSTTRCACGHPFRMIVDIEGRADDILYLLDDQGAKVPVHPHNLRSPAAEITEIKQYQIIQEEDGLHITLVLRNGAVTDDVIARLRDRFAGKLSSLGVRCPELHISVVDLIERDEEKMGKFRLIRSNIPTS